MVFENISTGETREKEKVSLESFSEFLHKHPAVARMLSAGVLVASLGNIKESQAQEVSDMGAGDYQRNFDKTEEVREKGDFQEDSSFTNRDTLETSEQESYEQKLKLAREAFSLFVIINQQEKLIGPPPRDPIDLAPALSAEEIEELSRENASKMSNKELQDLVDDFHSRYQEVLESGARFEKGRIELMR